MPTRNTDRNLLFGIIALQMDFISKEALLSAMNAWALDKSKSLGQILIDQQALTPKRLALLDSLVEEHLAEHDGDPEASLMAVGSAKHDVSVLKNLRHLQSHRLGDETQTSDGAEQ